jgi:hypothetical protein
MFAKRKDLLMEVVRLDLVEGTTTSTSQEHAYLHLANIMRLSKW